MTLEQKKRGEAVRREGRLHRRDRTTVAMAQGDPGLPGGHDIDDVRKVARRPGKWQQNNNEQDPKNEEYVVRQKEVSLSLREGIGSVLFGIGAGILAETLATGAFSMLFPLGVGILAGRLFRCAHITPVPHANHVYGVLSVVIGAGFLYMTALSLPLGLLALTAPSFIAGALLGHYDNSFFGLRKYYPKKK